MEPLRDKLLGLSEHVRWMSTAEGTASISAPVSEKLAVLRHLVCEGDAVEDIHLADEGLVDIYQRLIQLQEQS